MSIPELLKNLSEATPVSIVINKNTGIFPLEPYVYGYYVYIKVWYDKINDSLQCKIKENNKFGLSAIALIHDDGIKQRSYWPHSISSIEVFLSFFKTP